MDAAAARDAYSHLCAPALAAAEGWAGYVAGSLPQGRHVMHVATTNNLRTLERGEPFWWTKGLGDAFGRGELVDELAARAMPDLVTLKGAAEIMPGIDPWGKRRSARMGVEGIDYNLREGVLYPMYVQGVRYLFAAQVHELAARRNLAALQREAASVALVRVAAEVLETSEKQWRAVRDGLPPLIRPENIALDLTPSPSPDPLPVPASARGVHTAVRCVNALIIGAEAGWFTYVRSMEGQRVFVVRLDEVEQTLPAAGVLPWVLGVADYRGEAARVAYRQGLG
jgi:hypothetical protein